MSEPAPSRAVKDRVFELLDGASTTREIADDLGISYGEAVSLIRKVTEERGGTPQSLRIKQHLERIDKIQF